MYSLKDFISISNKKNVIFERYNDGSCMWFVVSIMIEIHYSKVMFNL